MAQTFRDELAVLRGIFPSWDTAVLQEVLETHHGNVERTVDSLLTAEPTPGAAEAQHSQPPRSPAQALGSPLRQSHTMVLESSSSNEKPCGRATIPDDFLRLPSDKLFELSEQEERDAILARMLQDQFFRDEVLSSEEFSSHFHDNRSSRPSQRYVPDKTATEIASETYTAMSEKFTSLSAVMKSKMHEMYMRFQMRNDAPASRDPKSQRPLMESDSESSEDEDLQFHSDVGHTDMELRHSQVSPRRSSAHNLTRRSNAGTSLYSKKDD